MPETEASPLACRNPSYTDARFAKDTVLEACKPASTINKDGNDDDALMHGVFPLWPYLDFQQAKFAVLDASDGFMERPLFSTFITFGSMLNAKVNLLRQDDLVSGACISDLISHLQVRARS